MRILAIRGCNLASLAGEFEIDLSRAPFSEAGVFAIVGNTGAGKSTLLDALCVALFDRTPRLTNHSRVVVGRGEDDPGALGAQDVRTLLRRGASAGYAEVDFEAGDMRRYRARWSVRRARNQTDGTLQDQQITLTEIASPAFAGARSDAEASRRSIASPGFAGARSDAEASRRSIASPGFAGARNDAEASRRSIAGERLGGTKTETLRAITSRLGLTFDQFRRSALLAQGEFAAFLRADGRDRSELLERMTGTEIYSRLSVAAHVKATLAEQSVREGRMRADAIPVLADEARVAAVNDLALAEEAKHAARGALSEAEAFARWRTEGKRLGAAHAEAERDHATAIAALTAAEPERAELALRRRAEQLRGVWEDHARIDRAVAIAQGEASVAESMLVVARATHESLVARRVSLAALHEPVRAARIAAGLVERVPQAFAMTTDVRGTNAMCDGGAVEDALHVAVSDAGWLVAHAALAPEVATWPELDTRFAQHGTLADAIASIDRAVRDHAQARAKLVKAREVVATEHAAANAKLLDAQRKTAGHLQRRGITLEVARRQEDEARTRLVEVERLVSIAANARDALRVRENIDQQLGELDAHAATDTEHRVRVLADRAGALVVRGERARVVDELRRAAGYEHARAELRDGDPCPLCGAEEHPWKTRGAFDDVIRAEETRLAEVTAQLEVLGNSLAQLAAREQQRAKDRQRLTRSRETAVASAATDVPRWREQLTSLGELLLETDPATAQAERIASELETAATARLEQARVVFGQAQAAAKAAQEAQAELQLAQANADQIQLQLSDHDRRIGELDATVQRLAGERTSRMERAAELDGELSGAMARWRAALESTDSQRAHGEPAPNGIQPARSSRRRVGTGVHEADLRAAIMRAADAPLTKVDARDLVAARGAMSEVAAAWRTRADRVSSADAAATGAFAAIERATRDAERAVTEHAARLDAALARRNGLIEELREASERLADALAGISEPILVDDPAARRAADHIDEDRRDQVELDTDNLRRLLAAAPSRIDELAALVDARERAVDRTRAIVLERRRRWEAHAGARPTSTSLACIAAAAVDDTDLAVEDAIDDAALEHRLRQLAAQVHDIEHRAAQLAAAIAADDDARARREAALALVAEAEHAAEMDRVLGEVIGSHDGKLFRSFAQSLTLDSLLAVANAHLEELAPRYQLERVPRHDLELQVIDRDLGAEVRSVQSLSGGESFLVSLALALGLSSMSAHDVRVRTLLIDEGFGTLDPATLDSALSVLDALQATGRQVGVISHVPALVERVGAHVRVIQRGGGRSEVIVA